MIKGKEFPKKAQNIIQEWALDHQNELLQNWALMEKDENLFKIPGADQ